MQSLIKGAAAAAVFAFVCTLTAAAPAIAAVTTAAIEMVVEKINRNQAANTASPPNPPLPLPYS